MKRGSEYGMCPVFKWGKCVRQIFGVMKRAVKWTSTDNDTSTSVNRQPSGKVQSCRSQPRKVQYCRCRPSTLTINANKLQPTVLFLVEVDHSALFFGQPRRSTSVAAFFSVDSRQPFSSRPKFLVSDRHMGSI